MFGDVLDGIVILLAIVGAAGILANFVPAPATLTNKYWRFLSRVIHLIAAQLSTAVKAAPATPTVTVAK